MNDEMKCRVYKQTFHVMKFGCTLFYELWSTFFLCYSSCWYTKLL